jgi:hypothetical protein
MKYPIKLWKLIVHYYKECQYLAGIQWENDDERISDTTDCERAILEWFGLPQAFKFSELLQFFSLKKELTTKSIHKLLNNLSRAATDYFLYEPVLTDKAMLLEAQSKEWSAYDVLPILGYETRIYEVFLIEHMLIKKKMLPEKIIQELKAVRSLTKDEATILYQARHNQRKLKQSFSMKLKYILKYHKHEMKKSLVEKEYSEGKFPF